MHPSLGERSGAWLAGLVSAVCALSLLAALVGAGPASAQAADPPECLYPGADAFGGTSLDLAERWTSTLRHDASAYTVADGKVKIQTGAGEIQSTDPAGGAPNIFLQPAPEGTWEITTKVKIDHTTEGQQAGLLLTDPTGLNLVKLAYVQKGPNDNNNKWIEFLKIVGGAYDFSGTWHSEPRSDYPDELWLRYRSDGTTLSGYFSTDGETWQPAGDPRSYEAIDDPQIGFYALRGGAASPVVTAEFDSFDLVPANDEFDGTAVDECRWTEIQNRNDAGMSVADGQLTLRTLQGELSNDESTVQNMLLQRTNDSDWQATTKLTMTPTTEGQQAGLVIWGDNTDPERSNNVKLVFVRKNGDATNNAWIEFLKTTDGVTDLDFDNQSRWNSGLGDYGPEVHLRLVSAGGQLAAYWSDDGTTWTKVGVTHPITGIENPQVGLMALKGPDAAKPEVDAKFDYFRIEPNETEPEPPAPDCTTQAEPETGFTKIFDGTQASFDQWEHAGQGYFTLNEDGSMTSGNDAAAPNYGLHWFKTEQYKNFSVRMQWKSAALTDNSGVFARFPDPGDDPDVAVNQGHEIQINENPAGDPQKTASIYNADRENHRNAKPLGEWNDYEITVVGQRYTVCLNGKVVNDYTSDKGRPLEGYIGVQNHDPTSKVSFRDIRVKELPDAPAVQNIFNTIGIATQENRANGQIHGTPLKYSYIAEQMPPSRSVGVPGDDPLDEVPVRMPDTRGVVANLASMAGQEYFFTEAQRKAYSKLHFYGATTDASGGQASGGDFTLTFTDGTTEKMTVRFRDWASTGGTEADHVAIRTNPRYTTEGTQGNIDFNIFHVPVAVSAANRDKVLASIKLPPNATPAGTNTRAYLMALTLEDAAGGFELPILAGNADFPNDTTPPTTTATVDPAEPDGAGGWYTGQVSVTLASDDEEGGSQVEAIEYRIGTGAWLQYEDAPVVIDTDGDRTIQYRAIDRAGNLETQKSLPVKIDSGAPEVEAELVPGLPAGTTWYDRPVQLVLDADDGFTGSGVAVTEYSIDGGAWTEYDDALAFDADGSYVVSYRATDVAGNTVATPGKVTVSIDRVAPVTTLRIDGAAPLGSYAQPAVLELSAVDGGSGAPTTEYRLDGGAWKPYAGAITVAELGLHRIEYRSVDAAGNPETTRQVAFNRVGAPVGGSGGPPSVAEPAPAPAPWAAVGAVRRSRSTVGAFRRGKLAVTIGCQGVERGTLRLTVSKPVAKRLRLSSTTLASAAVRCDGADATARLKPSKRVRRALARGRGAIKATLTLRLTGDRGAASDTARLTLRR